MSAHRATVALVVGPALAGLLLAGCTGSGTAPAPTSAYPTASSAPVTVPSDKVFQPAAVVTALPTAGPHRVTADEVRAVFEAQRGLTSAGPQARLFCGVDLLGQSPDLRLVYVWVDCAAYASATDPGLPDGGLRGAYRLDLVSGAILTAEGGMTYHEDLAKIFPPDVVERVVFERVRPDEDADALAARAVKAFGG